MAFLRAFRGGDSWQLAPGAQAAVAAAGWHGAPDVVADTRGAPARHTPARMTRRLDLPGGVTLYCKVHRRAWWQRLGPDPAQQEWQRLAQLAAAGVPVPEAILWARVAHGSALVTRAVPDATPLDAWLAAHRPGDQRGEFVLLRALTAQLAPLCARLHGAGFFHRDLYLCHWLLATPERPPVLIDLQRVGWARAPRRRWFVKDLAALHHSAPAWVSRGRRLRFLCRYLAARGLGASWRDWARAVVGKARRIAAHVPKYG